MFSSNSKKCFSVTKRNLKYDNLITKTLNRDKLNKTISNKYQEYIWSREITFNPKKKKISYSW